MKTRKLDSPIHIGATLIIHAQIYINIYGIMPILCYWFDIIAFLLANILNFQI